MLDTAERLAGMDIQGIKVHLLYVVKGTQLEKMYRQGRYRCLEQGEYVDLVCDFLERLPASFVIQRLTGDPHPHELVAPQWSLDKAKTRNLIDQTLVNRASWQGKYFSRRKSFETDQSI
jgi:radical SAM superfamily enzyme